ncbi:hypothetical protein B0A49_04421 [Cryomyces minteri]|uniref:Uncharacterized protein n=1 Tax=Cryomyces minteri TaxID=331657 RepID=A0A4U0X7G1_9PEZI|nr:hypothetical protein B0A49_04421 [Cryomyces minteri]
MAGLFRLLTQKWYPPADPTSSFAGRTVIITGSNTGLGFEAAVKFASLGASTLILGVRSLAKGAAAKRAIEARMSASTRCDIRVWHLDLLSYPSIRAFAARAAELERLDVAVLNAGVFMPAFETSAYGWERTLQVNVLSTTLLALLLLPVLRASKTADYTPTLEIVGSGTHYRVALTADEQRAEHLLDAFNTPEGYRPQRQYGTSKLLVMYALAGLAALGEPDVFVTSVCPGMCKSELGRGYDSWGMRVAKWVIFTFFARSTEQGARTLVSGTMLGAKGHGGFWQHDEVREPAPLLKGEDGRRLQEQVWHEITDALRKDVPEVLEVMKG